MRIPNQRILLALSALIVAGVAVYSSLGFIARKHRADVQQELHKLLGTDVSFETVEAGLWDGFSFRVKEFRIADDPRFAATPFVQAEELRLGLSLGHLFLGRFVINSLTFTRPELQIITNEDGLLNVTALTNRKKDLIAFPRLRTPAAEKKHNGLSFLITRLKIVDGRIAFIDRSINAPAELQIKKIDLDVVGVDVAARAKIKLAASLGAAVGQDVRMEGEMGPPALGKDWAQQPVNLDMEFDSLYLPMLARAIPFFRDRIPREFDITGPMYFHTRISGTLQQPRFTTITLKVPLLGSSEYNAILEGRGELTRDGDWGDAPIEGKLTLSAISLPQLRRLPFMRQILSDDFVTSGTIDVRSRFAGTWNQLRFGALLDADSSELRYPGRFEKQQGKPAQLRAQLTAHSAGYELHPSELRLGTLKVLASGRLAQDQNSRLSIRLKTSKNPLKAADLLLAASSFEAGGGNVDWDLLLERDLNSAQSGWEARGALNLDQVALRHRISGETIDRLTGSISFFGRRARASNISFRLGSTAASMSLEISDIRSPRARYSLQSDNLALTDLPFFAKLPGVMRNVLSSGEVTLAEGGHLQGVLTSSTGIFHGVTYRSLQTDISWSPRGINLKGLRMGAFSGELYAGSSWNVSGGQTREFWILPKIDSLRLNEVLARLAPQLKERFDGELDFSGEFEARALGDDALWETLTGSGAAVIRNGTVKDFNLVARLFERAGSQEQITNTTQDFPQGLTALLKREDTPVQELKATVTVKAQRLRTDNFSLLTSDYAISAAGSIALDGTTEGKGLLVFSPAVTQELQRQYGAIRYFLDRKGRLAVSFRLDGKLPNVRIRPENRALAQALRWGSWQRGDNLTGRKRRSEDTWLPESLERLLHR
jgi:AsmA-like C-terminal region/Domain of Unknown Function (DUF748)